MLKEMIRRNLLDFGAQQEFGNFSGHNKWTKAANKILVEISTAACGVELLNRYVSATSAYRLKMEQLNKVLKQER